MSIAEFNMTDGLPPIVIEKLNNNFRSVGNGKSSGSYIINQVIDSIAYMDLPDKPSINGVILVGDIDGDDLMLCPVDEAGVIQMYAGTTPPDGWLLCDGSAVSRTTYAALFAVIGTTYGAGDGSTTFNLPDLRGLQPYAVVNYIICTGK